MRRDYERGRMHYERGVAYERAMRFGASGAEAPEEPEVLPHAFVCPISLTIMRDPVTVVSVDTPDAAGRDTWLQVYDRESIRSLAPGAADPLTKKRVDSIIENEELQRSIDAWTRDVKRALEAFDGTLPGWATSLIAELPA